MNTIITISVYLIIIGSIVFGRDFKIKSWTSPRLVIAPILGIILILALTSMEIRDLLEVFSLKAGLVVLILSFAYLANSLDESGFFEFIALKIVKTAKGNSHRLFVFFFLMTSLLTYFTSNDVVILSITPILLYVGKKAEIRDMVPFLTAQFIAANTLSMGLYIGSPTNIVLGDALGLDFYSYFVQMLLPSVVSTIVTLGILYLLFAGFRFLGHSLPARYNQMNEEDIPKISFEMLFKAAIFFICLVTLSLAERWHLKLWIISLSYALLLLTLDLIFYGKHWRIERTDSYQKWRDSLIFRGRGHIIGHLHDRMPYTIVPFVFGFFFFVQAMSSFGVTDKIAGTIFEHYSQKGLISTTLFYGYISAFIVNIMNDIPATVFLSEVLKSVHFESNTFKQASILATAVGVNVGCYITYIGALAGIMWFKLIENQKKRGMITAVTPTKKEFFLIGIIVAPLVILSACMAIIFQVSK